LLLHANARYPFVIIQTQLSHSLHVWFADPIMRVLLGSVLLLCAAMPSKASHYRGGTISYRIPDPTTNPTTVEFTIVNGWRTLENLDLDFGDGGGGVTFSSNNIGSFTDSTSAAYTLYRSIVTHTYDSRGIYSAYVGTCCRIGGLVNDANGDFRLEVTVDIVNEKNSPIVQIPAIVQMYKQTNNVIDLKASINDSDNDGITCSFATGNKGYSPSPVASGNSLVLTNDCKLQWDLSSYNPGTIPRFSVSMWVLSSAGVARVPLDFIIEVIGGTPVTCGVTPNNSLKLTTSPGDFVTTQFEVNGGLAGTAVTGVSASVAGQGLISTQAPITSTTLLPVKYEFGYDVPANAADGQNFQSTIQWTLQNGQSCFQTVTVTVCVDTDGDTVCDTADKCPNADDTVDLNADGIPDCTVGAQPSEKPSAKPSVQPSVQPIAQPSVHPSAKPSAQPIAHPSAKPSAKPSAHPIAQPSAKPSVKPSAKPSAHPIAHPSAQPSFESISRSVCEDYAVHARTTITFDGTMSTIDGGDAGVSPGTSITGAYRFKDGTGRVVLESSAFAASVLVAYAVAMEVRREGRAMAIEIGGLTFTPGTYRSNSAINFAYGTVVTLDGLGQQNPVFLFQAGSTLVTAANSKFVLINGAKAENVYWALGTAATLGANSVLEGSILAGTAITFGTKSVLHGCALAQSAVTFESGGSIVKNRNFDNGKVNQYLRG
jgi:hypothetical protein